MEFLEEAIAKLSATPQLLEDAIRGLSEKQLSHKPSEFFSIRETVLHLRDIEVYGYEKRLRLMLTEDYPVLADIDGAKLAIERDYNLQPVQPALDDMKRSRATSVQRLKGTPPRDLERRAEMQGFGPIDVRRLLEFWMEHDRGHLADLAEMRRAIEANAGPNLAPHQAA
ncbi:MAG TPA: DinB family protein [Terriglobales bacterium]|nr:DinB family protein [Terriglobales bacterium]